MIVPTSIPALLSALRDGSLDLTSYIDQLEARFARREPAVLAFVPEPERFARLRREAAALLERYPTPAERPPLFGLPVGVKDIFHVAGLPTQAGSRLPADLLQGAPAASVQALLAAGALVFGKAVTTEFAYFGPGPTKNPHHPGHTPGGSSSGSAAAVGAGLVPFAVGTQTIGSINRPAAYCGVVGYKPSYDRISREGVIPLAESLDHIGGFTADVAGMGLVVPHLAAAWQPAEPVQELVLGIPAGPYLQRANEEGTEHFAVTCARLREAGIVLREVPVMADFDQIYARHQLIAAAEAARFHREWYAAYGDRYHPKTVELIARGKAVTEDELARARDGRAQLRAELTAVMSAEGLHGWVSPPAQGAAPAGLASTGDPVMNLPWTHAGLPTVTLPAGQNGEGLPLGLQLTGGWYGDEQLLAVAAMVETALP